MSENPVLPGSIVVGIDGSEHANHAVRWGARQAAAEHAPLTLLHAVNPLNLLKSGGFGALGVDHDQVRASALQQGQTTLRHAARLAESMAPHLQIEEVVYEGDPRTALQDASRVAGTLVLGTRGTGPLSSLVLGSTSAAVCQTAFCPVVVARPDDGRQPRRGVVVGADGTPESLPVIEYAFRQASLTAQPLAVMHAFWDVAGQQLRGRWVGPDERGLEDLRLMLGESVAGMAEKFPDVDATLLLSRGLVDECITDAGVGAELVVVGRHRRHAIARLFTGTVTATVLEHASCPVAVVPEGDSHDTPDAALNH